MMELEQLRAGHSKPEHLVAQKTCKTGPLLEPDETLY